MILLFSVLLGVHPTGAFASANPELTRYFSERLGHMQASLRKFDGGQEPSESMKLEKISIGLVPQVSFGLSGVLNLTVAPEIDFVLTPAEADEASPGR